MHTDDLIVEDLNHRRNSSKPVVTGSAANEALSELLKVAASLLINAPSSFAEDWQFSKSTPKKDRRKVLDSSAAVEEQHRLAAIKLKSIYDILAKHCR